MPFRIIPERSERPEYLIQSARAKGGDVFDDDVTRREGFDRFSVLEPQSAAFTGESSTFSSEANVLTWESSAKKVNWFDGSPVDRFDIPVSGNGWPVLGEHSPAPLVDFNLPRNFKSCSFKAKVKSSYACE
jgi:hypothetical protein